VGVHLQIQMRNDEQCKVLCRIEKLTDSQAKAFKEKVEDDYKVNMYVDEAETAS
jgi:transmembrane 9 superfamily protein 2/4